MSNKILLVQPDGLATLDKAPLDRLTGVWRALAHNSELCAVKWPHNEQHRDLQVAATAEALKSDLIVVAATAQIASVRCAAPSVPIAALPLTDEDFLACLEESAADADFVWAPRGWRSVAPATLPPDVSLIDLCDVLNPRSPSTEPHPGSVYVTGCPEFWSQHLNSLQHLLREMKRSPAYELITTTPGLTDLFNRSGLNTDRVLPLDQGIFGIDRCERLIALDCGQAAMQDILDFAVAERPIYLPEFSSEPVDGKSARRVESPENLKDWILRTPPSDMNTVLNDMGVGDVQRLELDLSEALESAGLKAAPRSPSKVSLSGLSLEEADVTYNRWSRLVTLRVVVTSDLPPTAFSGQFRSTSADALSNAWPRSPWRKGDQVVVHAFAVLPPDVTLSSMSFQLTALGVVVSELRLEPLAAERQCDFIGFNPTHDGSVDIEYWTNDLDVEVQCGRNRSKGELRAIEGEGELPHFGRVSATWPFDRDSLALVPSSGVRTPITNFSKWTAAYKPSSRRLQSLRDSLSGRTAWLIGNGPSVDPADLDRLGDTVTFAFNRFHLAYDRTRLRPTFTVTGDRQMIEDFGDEIVASSSGEVIVADLEPPSLPGEYIWVRQISGVGALFSRDPSRAVSPGGSSVYVAMQVAFFLGIRRIYLYGMDFNFNFDAQLSTGDPFRSAVGDGNHFIKNYRSGKAWCPPAIENIANAFFGARMLFQAEGGFIKNATRGGAMEIFERIEFEDAVAGAGIPSPVYAA